MIKAKDFTSKFQEVGQKEIDKLINVYNNMIDHLREERLKLQEKTYFIEKIIHNSPTGVIIFDYDGNIDLVNPSAENFLANPLHRLKGKKLSGIESSLAKKLTRIDTGKPGIISLNGNRKFKVHKLYFLDRGFTRDFIMIEELTKEIQQSEKNAYEKIIRVMAHEVNNSVGAANSLLHSCLNYKAQISEQDRKDFVSALSVAISRAEHLNKFIKSYADVIKLPEPKFQKCKILELTENIIILLKPKLKEKNIQLKWDIDNSLTASLDKNQMEQVIV
ncbi:PAS domain-containing sensor histidine kinase, partial [candidate division KSB1 bacterium]